MAKQRVRIDDQTNQRRAEVLAEALPWINESAGKTFVVKYGGSAMEDPALCKQVVADIVLMKLVGIRVVLVHGGGKAISRLMDALQLEVAFKNGLRVTDDAAMRAVQMALVGEVNQMLVAQVNAYGDYGVSITGADGRTLEAVPISPDLGRVGAVSRVNTRLIESILDDGYIPIIAGVGWAPSGAYNINADLAASEIAIALHADKLIYLSDVDGLYRDFSDKDSLLSSLTLSDARELIASGTLESGMIPKVKSSADALEAGVGNVHFLNGTYPHSLLLEVFTNAGIGTWFKQDE
jgi:acetylglutamate kinase